MSSVRRLLFGLVLVVALGAAPACVNPAGTSSSSPLASSSTKASTSPSQLDPEVPMLSGFPPDVPIYPGARLTAAAQFASNGQTAWGMEWETLAGVDKVQAFYAAKLAQGDWTLGSSSSANGPYTATFRRKSNSKVGGILGADGSSGVTKISLALGTGA